MTHAEHQQVVQLLFSIAGLWFVYAYVFKKSCQRALREDMFTIRDNLFDYMWRNGLSYDLAAYGRMRYYLNGIIRSSEHLNLMPVLLLLYLARRRGREPDRLTTAIVDVEDTEVRQHFEKVRTELEARLWKYLFLEGPQWLLFKPLDFFYRHSSKDRGRPRPPAGSQAIVDDVIALGKKNSPEARFLARHSAAV